MVWIYMMLVVLFLAGLAATVAPMPRLGRVVDLAVSTLLGTVLALMQFLLFVVAPAGLAEIWGFGFRTTFLVAAALLGTFWAAAAVQVVRHRLHKKAAATAN